MIVLSRHCPTSLLDPVIRDTKTKTLLQAMSDLARKAGRKIGLSKAKNKLDKYLVAGSSRVGVDWGEVRVYPSLVNMQTVRGAVKGWGNKLWQLRWSNLPSCRQTKLWFPTSWGAQTSQIRRLSRNDLGRFIHFTTGHNHLRRHESLLTGGGEVKCRLCGMENEDALHLWADCVETRGLRRGDPAMRAQPTLGPGTWTVIQLSRFLREPLIVELLDRVGAEQSENSQLRQ